MSFAFNTIPGQCQDTDFGALDNGSYPCAGYEEGADYCDGRDDNEDFRAQEMCCACGGGITS